MTDLAFRLRKAREAAGFPTAADAAARFGWNYPTYAGHENGHRGVRNDALQTYARAFKVQTCWLLDGRGDVAAPQAAPGFHESSVEPLTGQTPQARRALDDLAIAATPASRHQTILRCTRDHPAYGIRRGDYLVIGTPNGAPTTGVVVVNLLDEQTAQGFTVLRQDHPSGPIAAIGDAIPDEDRLTSAIMGHVLAVIRAPQLLGQ